jgi:cell division cycle 2-like
MLHPSPRSRKRSKWDVEEDERRSSSSQQVPLERRRVKPRRGEPTLSGTLPRRRSNDSQHIKGCPRSLYVPGRMNHPPIISSRSVYCYERLNQIEEGSYGIVFRAKDRQTGGIVALKKLKLDEEKSGFPITALREINALMTCRHDNVVGIREVVVGDTLTQ